MSVSTSTAPDFYPVVKDFPRVAVDAGATLELLVLSADDSHCAGVDLASGALVRAWSPEPSAHRMRPYDVVSVTLDENADGVPDPHEPEALVLVGPPEPLRRVSGRRVERLLRRLAASPGPAVAGGHVVCGPVLGAPTGPSLHRVGRAGGSHQPVAATVPTWPAVSAGSGTSASCPAWTGIVAAVMDRSGRTRMAAGKDDRLLVALTPPIDGRCHKVVEAVLPRP